MSFLDKRSDTEKEISEYYENRNKQTNNGDINAQGITGDGLNTAIQRATQEDYDRAAKRLEEQKSKGNIVGGFVTLFGVAVIVAILILVENEILSQNVLWIFMCGLFILIGLCLAIIPQIKSAKKKKHCQYPVKAKIENIKKEHIRTEKGHKIYEYTFTYKYLYSNKEYILMTKTVPTTKLPEVGDEIDLLINGNYPEDYYISEKVGNIVMLIMGIMFIVLPLLALIPILLEASKY